MDKKAGTGELSCKVCGQSFQTGINCELYGSQPRFADCGGCALNVLIRPCLDLSAAVDIYSDWIDACDTVAKEAADAEKLDGPSSYAGLVTGVNGRRNSNMEVDRHPVDVVDDDDDDDDDEGEAAYAEI